MPELPEAEVTRYALSKTLIGKKLLSHISFTNKLRFDIPSDNQIQKLYSKSITSVIRRGKTVCIIFETGILLSIHFGMTGFLEANLNKSSLREKHEHIRFKFSPSLWLSYFDYRRFGSINLSNCIPDTAIDPLSNDFTPDLLFNLIKSKKSCIKTILMNQTYIAGIGNIYASEALFTAGILPYTHANALSFSAIKKLTKAIKTVLKSAIASGKTQFDKQGQVNKQLMKFPTGARVYSKANELCSVCNKTIIQSIIITGRNSFYCSSCQQ